MLCESPESAEKNALCWQFIKEGLSTGEKVLIVIAQVPAEEMKAGLKNLDVAFDEELGKGRIAFLNWSEISMTDKTGGSLRLPSLIAMKFAELGVGVKKRVLLVGLHHILASIPKDQLSKFVSELVGQIRSGVSLGSVVVDPDKVSADSIPSIREPFDGVLRISRDSLGKGLMIGVDSFDGVERVGIFLPLGKVGAEIVAGLAAMKGPGAEACPQCGFQVLPGFDVCPRCKTELKKVRAVPPPGAPSVFDYLEKMRIETGIGEPVDDAGRADDARKKKLEEFLQSVGVLEEKDQEVAKEKLRALARSRATPSRSTKAPGRTNGLTNGLSKPSGLVNGLARTSGMVNGLGRTTGKVNGTGRTNGLVNGLQKARRGMTNGLTNGNGFTNGLGSKRFQKQTRNARWKLLIVPGVAAILLITPMLVPTALFEPVFVLQADGSFGEWSGSASFGRNQSMNSAVDLFGGDVKSDEGRLGLYFEVVGSILAGDASGISSDIMEAYVDIDHDASTGYSVGGIGAEYMLQTVGQGHSILRSGLFTWSQRSSSSNLDWTNWKREVPLSVFLGSGSDSGKMEATVDIIGPPSSNAASIASGRVLLHSQSWDNQEDFSDFTLTEGRPSLQVVQTSVAPPVAPSGEVAILKLSFNSFRGTSAVQGVDLDVLGTATSGSITAFTVRDESGNTLGTRVYGGGQASINFNSPLSVDASWTNVTVYATVTGSSGSTLGLSLKDTDSVRAGEATVSISSEWSARQKTYLGIVPSGVVIDGAFEDWTGANSDSKGDGSTRRNDAVDITGFDAHRDSPSKISFYARVEGVLMAGTTDPMLLPGRQQTAPSPDSDHDTVPDSFEETFNNILPHDFNNDNISDASSNHDVDGDGVLDAPFGPDLWLNTTIPNWYGNPFGGRAVSVYIGPEIMPPPNYGEDKLRIFIDSDEVVGSGFLVRGIYADNMVEVSGKNGKILSGRYLHFTGPTPYTWRWTDSGAVSYATGRSEMEGDLTIPGMPPAANVTVVLDLRDWRGNWDDTNPARTRSMTRSGDGGATIQRESYGVQYPGRISGGELSFRDSQGYGLSWRITEIILSDGGRIVEQLPLADESLALSGLDATYAASDSGVSVVYTAEADRLKEELILPRPPSSLSSGSDELAVEFSITYLGGISPDTSGSVATRTDGPGMQTYSFTTSGGLAFAYGQIPAFALAPAIATDAGGVTVGCTYTFGDGGNPLKLRVGCPADWLRSAKYPVKVDPTILMNGYRGESFGYSLAIGDFNGDAKGDLLVGAPNNNLGGSGAGRAYVYLGGAAMDNVVDLEIPSQSSGSHFGWSVAAGDINNDGYSDMIVGAPDYSSGEGRVYIYMGSSTLNSILDYSLLSRQTGEGFGYSLAVGNYNADSYKDVLVGAPFNDTGGTDIGSAYIYFGAADFDNGVDKILHGANSAETFGYAVGVGDFNNDGYSDAAVGAPEYIAGGPAHPADGRVGVYFGGSSMDTTQDVDCNNGNLNEELGTSVTSADFNADGYEDLYAGGPYFNYPNNQGRVPIYYGGASMNGGMDGSLPSPGNFAYFGISVAKGKVGSTGLPEVAVGSPLYIQGGSPLERGRFNLFWNGTAGSFAFRNGDNDYDHFGYKVAIGDVNSSSTFGELVVGAIDFDIVDSTNSGKVYIFNGGNPGGFDTTPDLHILSRDPGSRSGEMLGYSVATGDFNGDGKQDVLAGAPTNAYGGTSNTGVAFIYFGKPFQDDSYYGPDLMLPGQYGGESFGWNVSAGDVNADGYDDAIVGAPYNDEGGTDIGRAYVFYGGSSMNSAVDVDIAGQSTGELFGWDVASGNVNGDQSGGRALKDIIVGAPQNGTGKGRVYVYFGSTSLGSVLATPNAKLYRGDTEAFGSSVAVGNFNEDAYADIIVGAPLNDTASTDIGAAYIYRGCSNWGNCFRDPDINFYYSAYANSKGANDDTTDLLSDAQTDNAANDNNPPSAVTSGDGWYTVAKGNQMHFNTMYLGGWSYGSIVGAKIQVQYSAYSAGGGYSGNSSVMWKYSGSGWANTAITPANNQFGIVGTHEIYSGGVNTKTKVGTVQVFFHNYDGGGDNPVSFDYVTVNVTLRGQQPANVTLKGQVNLEHFGHSVETGDFDGDSAYLDDAVVGAPYWYSNTNDTGAVYVYSGSTIRATANGGSIGTPMRQVNSPSGTTAKFGWSLASGNLNGDAYDDLIVGAPFNNSNMGAVSFYYGPTSSMTLKFISSGEQNEKRGFALATADLITGYNAEAAMGGPAWDGSSNDGRVVLLNPIPEFGDAVLPVVIVVLVVLTAWRRRSRRSR